MLYYHYTSIRHEYLILIWPTLVFIAAFSTKRFCNLGYVLYNKWLRELMYLFFSVIVKKEDGNSWFHFSCILGFTACRNAASTTAQLHITCGEPHCRYFIIEASICAFLPPAYFLMRSYSRGRVTKWKGKCGAQLGGTGRSSKGRRFRNCVATGRKLTQSCLMTIECVSFVNIFTAFIVVLIRFELIAIVFFIWFFFRRIQFQPVSTTPAAATSVDVNRVAIRAKIITPATSSVREETWKRN